MATSELVGYGPCPVCSHPGARYGLTIKGHVCGVCNACNVQILARSETSDLRLKAMVRGQERPGSDPPAPAPGPAPAPAPTPEPPAADPPRRRGWLAGLYD